jgi:succinate dehydrogenase (ubiquinone) cytochrome b560 subunit
MGYRLRPLACFWVAIRVGHYGSRIGALPVVVKVSLKAIMALQFTYHSFNGVRHLIWDLGLGLSNPAAIKSGWTVVGLSMLSALALAFM